MGYCQFLRHRVRTQNSTERLHQPFRMQSRPTVLSMMRKGATIQALLDHSLSFFFFPKRVERIESSKEPEAVPSTSGVSEFAVCPPSSSAEDISAPIPSVSPSSSRYLFLPVHWMPVPGCQLLYCTTGLCKVLYCQKHFFYFLFLLLCVICGKSIVNLLQYSAIQPIVLVGYLG